MSYSYLVGLDVYILVGVFIYSKFPMLLVFEQRRQQKSRADPEIFDRRVGSKPTKKKLTGFIIILSSIYFAEGVLLQSFPAFHGLDNWINL